MSDIKFEYTKLSTKTDTQLVEHLLQLKKALFNLRFQLAFKDMKDTSMFRKLRVSIAKINTEMSRRKFFGGENA
jgi:ribosomal protein L29